MLMAVLVVVTFLLAMVGGISGAQWCTCKTGLSDQALQKTLDYACGAGADCTPILQNSACFQPNTVRDHCSYAANSYFQRKGQAAGTCDFSGTCSVVTTDPSPGGSSCSYPSSASGTGTPPSTTNPISNTPFGSSPNGMGGGISTGLGPTGGILNNNDSGAFLAKADMGFLSLALLSSAIILFLRAY